METIILTENQLKLIISDSDLKKFVVSQYIGSDDILTVNGCDIKDMFVEDFLEDESDNVQNINLSILLDWYLKDVSGNSFDIITINNDVLVKIKIEI